MAFVIDIALAICLVILAAGAVHWVNTYLGQRGSAGARDAAAGRGADLDERLDDMERRLTDVQDVMIALSEKFDRWDERRQPH